MGTWFVIASLQLTHEHGSMIPHPLHDFLFFLG